MEGREGGREGGRVGGRLVVCMKKRGPFLHHNKGVYMQTESEARRQASPPLTEEACGAYAGRSSIITAALL